LDVKLNFYLLFLRAGGFAFLYSLNYRLDNYAVTINNKNINQIEPYHDFLIEIFSH